ncbi:hypothetical protein R1sor_021941 [Riccia sorocarpa]|uniref:ABC transporter domain-containing protein n=1 Tax=Riccia sorocarpa TaxID=122646 RepID=A0ABD3GLR8_9MARC
MMKSEEQGFNGAHEIRINESRNGIAQMSQVPSVSSVATFGTQANALLRKNLTFQRRNYKTNACIIIFPVLICLILFGLQVGVNKLLDKPSFKCGCETRIVNGNPVELCGLPYTTDTAQTQFCAVEHPPQWPALMQVPNPRLGQFPDFPEFSAFSRGAAILYTADDSQTAADLSTLLIRNQADTTTTDSLIQYASIVTGSSSVMDETLLIERAFVRDSVFVLQRQTCTNREVYPLNLTYDLAGVEVAFNGTPRCLQTVLRYDDSVAEINSRIYRAAQTRIRLDDKRHNDFVTAYDFRDTSARNSKLNVSVFYNAYGSDSFQPSEYYRVARPMNLAAQAFLRYLGGTQARLSLWFVKEMPRAASQLRLNFTILLGPLFFMWISALLFPVIMTTLVYEKQKNLRMMMKMHGLGDGPYWVITYGYFLVLSLLYFFAFVALGSAVDLKFFRLNSYSIQFVFFFVYMNLQIALSFLAATMFQNAKTATVCGYMYVFGFGLLGSFFFQSYVEDEHVGRGWIFGMELLPGFSLFRGLYELQYYGNLGDDLGTNGMQWRNLDDPKNGLRTVFLIQTAEWFIFLLLTFYLDQVLPTSGSGMRKHPLFFLGCSRTPRNKSAQKTVRDEERSLSSSSPNVFRGIDMEKMDVLAEKTRVEELRSTSNNTCAIVCDNLRKIYPGTDGNRNNYAVRGVSLAVERGECFGMLGPNGAGKSTTINMMVGLLSPTSGSAYIHGLDIRKDMTTIHTSMGVCPQHDLLWEQLTGREHLLFYGRLKNLKGIALTNAVEASLKSVNLKNVGNKRVKAYSGGMKRRLSVAISLIGDPRVVYMDEPGTGLDPASRNSLWKVVKEAKKDRAIILTTHSMEEAEALCDRLCIFVNGQLQCIGNSKELTSRYGGAYVLTMTTPEEEEQDVIDLVETLSPHSQRIYALAGTQKFEIPKAEVEIGRVFATVVKAKRKMHIQAWGISDTTLEDVFIKVARDAQQEDAEWS